MLAKALVASFAACHLGLVLAKEDEAFAQFLAEDSECSAEGSEGSQCALNALQHQARQRKMDMESSEGADLVEAAREWYASYSDEHVEASTRAWANRTDGGQTAQGMTSAHTGIAPPRTPFEYNGKSWPELTVHEVPGQEIHFFAIGDWGGMDGALMPPDDLPRMITYPGGHLHGPHVFPRSRLMCGHDTLNDCYFGGKKQCSHYCGFAEGIDDKAQLLVAEQLKKRAALHDPKFILNVGDNFYWGGIAKTCGHPMHQIDPATRHQFTSIFEEVYRGKGLDGKPWLSVLGNHDWGGRMFTAGWDQQIAYTWSQGGSRRWLMPAVYWHQRVKFPGYDADIYMVDTNFNDAKGKRHDKDHNICGASFNVKGATCASAHGPKSVDDCEGWFHKLWRKEQKWLEQHLSQSEAQWQIAVTHFPCDKSPSFWRGLHNKYGLDLLVTGHRHDQELWKAHHGMLGGLTCFVTGGGGGITSEESPLPGTPTHGWPHVGTQYGFFDMTISKDAIKIESIDYMGDVVDSAEILPTAR